MRLIKYLLFTIIFIIILEVSALWSLVLDYFNVDYIQYYNLIQGCIQLLIIILFLHTSQIESFYKLFDKPELRWNGLAFLLGILFVIIQAPLNLIYNHIAGSEYSIIFDFSGINRFQSLNIISLVLLIPISEELFFRGYIQRKLQTELKPIKSILIAAFLFALIHAPYTNLIYIYFEMDSIYMRDWHQVYITFFGGITSGFIYYCSKSIIPSFIFHISWNTLAIIL